MRNRFVWLGVLGVVALAMAEKPNMTPAALRKTATHVVVGKVTAIYTRVSMEGRWRYTRYVAEVKIHKVEKGDSLKAGGLVYARYWDREWLGRDMPTSTSGHRGLPKEGETLRMYLARNARDGFSGADKNNDGGYNVVGANGFERLKKSG